MPNTRSPLALLKQTFHDWSEDNALRLAASLAFYTVWSIGPLFLVAISVAGLVFGRDAAQGQVVETLKGLVGEGGARSIEAAISNAYASGHSVVANVVGVITLLVAASGVFAELESSLDTVWHVAPKPGKLWRTVGRRFLSLTMVLGMGFLLLVALIVSAAISAVGHHVGLPAGEGVWRIAHIAISLGVTSGLFMLIFKIVPDAHVAWKDVWLGGVVTAVLFTLGQVAIGVYFGKTSIGSAYGAASSLMIVLVWIYFSTSVLLFGAEFTRSYANMYGSQIRPTKDAMKMASPTPQDSASRVGT